MADIKFSEFPQVVEADGYNGSPYAVGFQVQNGNPVNVKIPLSEIGEAPTLVLRMTSQNGMPIAGQENAWNVNPILESPDCDWNYDANGGAGALRFLRAGCYKLTLVAKVKAPEDFYGQPGPWPDGFAEIGTYLQDNSPYYARAYPANRQGHHKYGVGGGYISYVGYVNEESFTNEFVMHVVQGYSMPIAVYNRWFIFDPSGNSFVVEVALSCKRLGDATGSFA